MTLPPLHALHWRQAWRIVPTRIPRINLYERLAAPSDQGDLIKLEQWTNPRVRIEKGISNPLRKQDYFNAKASVYIKAAFANLAMSRFGDGHIPLLYAASLERTALEEKKHHDSQFWAAHKTPPMSEKRRALVLNISGKFHDIRNRKGSFAGVYSSKSYAASQALGTSLWKADSLGIAYNSLRHSTGDCLAVFSPQTIHTCSLAAIYEFHWDGKRITQTYRLGPIS